MAKYRLYSVDRNGHVVGPPKVVACASDEAVISKVKTMVDGLGIEIWNGTRRVRKLPSKY
jgi:hypothetical protein